MNSLSKQENKLFDEIKRFYPAYTFTGARVFSWDPNTATITYPDSIAINSEFIASLLHEIGHAELSHTNFKHDVDLLKIERSAWDKAIEIANTFSITIDQDHLEDTMDTYRDWLYSRSLCPTCKQCGVQISATQYACGFCRAHWKVNKSRMCRVTRNIIKKSP